MSDFLKSMEEWGWVVWIGSHWILDAISMLHYFTIFWTVGTIALIDLRILGLVGMRQTATEWQEQLSPWMWTAMTICLVTGFLEFAPGASDFYVSGAFKIKIGLAIVGVILAIVVNGQVPQWESGPFIPGIAKVLAASCLLCWIACILWAVEIANYGFF